MKENMKKSEFDTSLFYEMAEQGERPSVDQLREYVNSFDEVIIWGAGNLGTALGKTLIEKEFRIDVYWDARFDEKGICNGLNVIEPFTKKSETENTLVIIGIVNGTLSHRWQPEELRKRGYDNYLLGMYVYEAVACPLEIGKPYEAKICAGTNVCNFNTCKRYMNILKGGKEKTGLSVQVLEIIVSARCTLDCRYCGQQVGGTKRSFPEKYIDYPLDTIIRSIDLVMDRLDVVGTFSVIGGEPFIHPRIGDIIKHCLSKKNVAIIAITTNGICNLTDDLIEVLKNDRIKINFSDYTPALSEKQRQLFSDNVQKIKKNGISCNVASPIWNTVSDELRMNPDFSDETLDRTRSLCVFGPSIAGNILYACPQTERYHRMELYDVDEDIIDLNTDEEHLTEKMGMLFEKSHYKACGYRCSNCIPPQIIPPGEQWN